MSDTERWLHQRVRELRDEEERLAPAYIRPAGRPNEIAVPARWGWGLAAAALAALLATGLWWRAGEPRPESVDEEAALALADSLSTWTGPLDFLLDVPGAEILGGEPLVPRGKARQLIDLVETEPLGSWKEI